MNDDHIVQFLTDIEKAGSSSVLSKVTEPFAERMAESLRRMLISPINPFSLLYNFIHIEIESYNPNDFPTLSSIDVVSYLMLSTSFYTQQQIKAYKRLQAYKYFEAGFVIHKIKHSQKMKEPPLQAWVVCNQDGSVETGHCTCMAGAEVCSHVGAILYAQQYIIAASKDNISCTDVRSLWNVPKTAKVACKPIRADLTAQTVTETQPSMSLSNQTLPPLSHQNTLLQHTESELPNVNTEEIGNKETHSKRSINEVISRETNTAPQESPFVTPKSTGTLKSQRKLNLKKCIRIYPFHP
ncbi:unnamed protein product [Diabrotica balteata]|uniref:SWIM-type domain-containing protein n=1 Tax=Diabrotica balteata TaxID=107213 RepID=A0A9N9SQW2_DIABA|nr:unnamed protein product [Diabrotica balteata]